MSLNDLKQQIIKAIEYRKEDLYSIADSIFKEPELGYQEFKTADKIKNIFKKYNISYREKIARTGIIGTISSENPKYHIAILSELDSVISPNHPSADPETGAAHCCGHHAMVTAMIGVLYAFIDLNLLDQFEGKVSFMGIPAEEYAQLGFRNKLIKNEEISFLGGKQEFIKLGEFEDVDIAIMHHLYPSEGELENPIKAYGTYSFNGFIGQEIEFLGHASHAGNAPELGRNSLQAAQLALSSINANRETFKDEDMIRVHPIIVEGGQIVNTVPNYVKLETYVRGATIEGILDATKKVNRSWMAGALAMGNQVKITTIPGYLPEKPDKNLIDIMYENLKLLFHENEVERLGPSSAAGSDLGDLSSILPCIQTRIGGISGALHSQEFEVIDPEIAYIKSSQALALTLLDLLYDNGTLANKVITEYKPLYTREEYLEEWGNIGKTLSFTFDSKNFENNL